VDIFNREQNRQGVFAIRTSLSQINTEGFFTESCYDCECLDVTSSTAGFKINVERTGSSIQLEPLNTRPETPLVSEQSCDHCFLLTIPAYFNRNTGVGTCFSCSSCKKNGWISTQTTWTRKTDSVWASCNVYYTITEEGKNKSVDRLKHQFYIW